MFSVLCTTHPENQGTAQGTEEGDIQRSGGKKRTLQESLMDVLLEIVSFNLPKPRSNLENIWTSESDYGPFNKYTLRSWMHQGALKEALSI